MTRRSRAAGTVLIASLVLLSGCQADGSAGSGGPLTVDVDVDTPDLRRLKQEAGVEPCPEGAPWLDAGAEPPDKALPDVTLDCLGGGADVDLSALRGPMVVNLWASWCGPCREELPFYQDFYEQAAGRVGVLGIDYEDTRPEAALSLVKSSGVTYPLVADPGGAVDAALHVRGLPAAVFVDEDGSVVHAEYVVIRSTAQLAGLVEEHLGVTVGPAG